MNVVINEDFFSVIVKKQNLGGALYIHPPPSPKKKVLNLLLVLSTAMWTVWVFNSILGTTLLQCFRFILILHTTNSGGKSDVQISIKPINHAVKSEAPQSPPNPGT